MTGKCSISRLWVKRPGFWNNYLLCKRIYLFNPMPNQVGTFTVEDAFHISGRGWVLVGPVQGICNSGMQLIFSAAATWPITGITGPNKDGSISLLVPAPFSKRQELLDQQIIGTTARILE
jgi:hypothetical protein